MDAMDGVFAELKDYLWQWPLAYCFVYRVTLGEAGPDLKWCKAISPYVHTHEEYDKLASRCGDGVLGYYIRAKDEVFRHDPPRMNPYGQEWWGLVVASGATRDAGYAIWATVGAMNVEEVQERIAGIQEIMAFSPK